MQVWLRRYANVNIKIIHPAGHHTLLVNISSCPVPTYIKQDTITLMNRHKHTDAKTGRYN